MPGHGEYHTIRMLIYQHLSLYFVTVHSTPFAKAASQLSRRFTANFDHKFVVIKLKYVYNIVIQIIDGYYISYYFLFYLFLANILAVYIYVYQKECLL